MLQSTQQVLVASRSVRQIQRQLQVIPAPKVLLSPSL